MKHVQAANGKRPVFPVAANMPVVRRAASCSPPPIYSRAFVNPPQYIVDILEDRTFRAGGGPKFINSAPDFLDFTSKFIDSTPEFINSRVEFSNLVPKFRRV
jgi:hypothetical protein